MIKKRYVVLAVMVILLGILLYVFNKISYVTVTVKNIDLSQETEYTFTNQQSSKSTTVKTNGATIKQRLTKGDYEVSVKQKDATFTAIANTQGFFRNTTVSGEMGTEKARSFVGNNPSPCMFYDEVLVSFVCGGSLQKLNLHVPATASSPTYVTQPFKNMYDTFEDTVTVKNGTLLVLANTPPVEDVRDGQHTLYTLSAKGELSNPVTIKGLDSGKSYKLAPYKEGFIAYTPTFDSILYYQNASANPVAINVDKPKNDKLSGFSLQSSGDSLVLVYSEINSGDISDSDESSSKDLKNEVVLFRDNKVTRHTLKTHGGSLTFCGDSKLCMIEDKHLKVYDTTGDKLKYLYSVNDVQAIQTTQEGTLLTRSGQIVLFNVNTRQGYTAYSFGGYSYCGQNDSGDNLLLCLINNKSQKVALLLDLSAPMTEPIDKQVYELIKQADIRDVSAYKNFVYIAPNYGRVVFQPTTRSYGYDPAVMKVVNSSISKKVLELGINQKVYTIAGISN